MHPLVAPVPGGPELLVLLGMALIYLTVPLLIVVAVYNFLDAKRGYERRISALERRVEELEDE